MVSTRPRRPFVLASPLLLKGCSKDLFRVGKITYHVTGYTPQDIGSVLLFLLSLALFQSSTNRRLTLCFGPVPPSHLTLRSGTGV
jgi:hypothetical protein